MKLNFIKMNPTENMTVFILDPLPRNQYSTIAKQVMAYSSLCAEQVGFIEKTANESSGACLRLEMMGGEFCGNATRALAAALVYRNHCSIVSEGKTKNLKLEVSGIQEEIQCEVLEKNDKNYQSSIMMPMHKNIRSHEMVFEKKTYVGTLVEFSGIMHYVIEGVPKSKRVPFFEALKNTVNIKAYDAFGIMYFEKNRSYITPLVYVKATDSLIWERGCGSGSTAVGIALSYENKSSVDVEIKQPGGSLRVTTTWHGNDVETARLDGEVTVVAEGVLQV